MCGIFGSKNKEKFIELMKLNAYRGSFSHSIAYLDLTANTAPRIIKHLGLMDVNSIEDISENMYYLGHVQAPTSKDRYSVDNIHPAELESNYLWHNGIIKDICVKELQKNQGTTIEWDTKLLLKHVIDNNSLSNIDGSFTCVHIDNNNNISIFRNIISPLFINDSMDISSVKFKDSKAVPYEKIFRLTENEIEFSGVEFKTKNNPYLL